MEFTKGFMLINIQCGAKSEVILNSDFAGRLGLINYEWKIKIIELIVSNFS